MTDGKRKTRGDEPAGTVEKMEKTIGRGKVECPKTQIHPLRNQAQLNFVSLRSPLDYVWHGRVVKVKMNVS
ncbi:MAG TPA: hypothetical protein VEI01_07880 [Terriglobales bacterium]|nr:hypothetical protein [Terriglobales bacterium]